MGSALGVGFQPSPPSQSAETTEANQKQGNISGSDILVSRYTFSAFYNIFVLNFERSLDKNELKG